MLDLLTSDLPPNRDYVTTGGAILMTMLTVIGGIIIALIQSNRKLTRRGAEAAQVAADRSEPTGNGFAKEVRAALRRLEVQNGRIEAQQRAHTRDIGGIREEIRLERVERNVLAAAVSNFIERNDDE